MMMYRCDDCGKIFSEEETKIVSENIGECWGQPAYISRYCCPHCEGIGFSEVQSCKICGKYSDEAFCEDCKNNITERLRFFYLAFAPEERELLREVMEEFDYD